MKTRTTVGAVAVAALALLAMGAGAQTAPSASAEPTTTPATQPAEARANAGESATQPRAESKDIFDDTAGSAGVATSQSSATTRPSPTAEAGGSVGSSEGSAGADDAKPSTSTGRSERSARSGRRGSGGDSRASGGSGGSASSANAAPAHPSWSTYRIIVDRNIFVRGGVLRSLFDNERRTRRNEDRVSTQPSPTSPAAWVLRGTALESGDRVAFLENSVTSETRRVHAGEAVAGVRLVEVEPTGAVLQGRGGKLNIAIGTQLDGSAAPLSMPTTAPSGDTTSASAGTPGTAGTPGSGTTGGATSGTPAASSSEAAIIERMKARRAQEVSK